MKTTRSRAIVLRRTNYGEADRVLDLLTPDGRMSVMARAVRKEKSKLAGGIELFAVCDVVVGEGKGGLGVLTSARLVHFYRHILEDYDRMQFAYETLAQITKASASILDSSKILTTPDSSRSPRNHFSSVNVESSTLSSDKMASSSIGYDSGASEVLHESSAEAEWYDIAAEVLAALDVTSVPLPLVQTWFYVRVAQLLGDELNVVRDTAGVKLSPDKKYRYDSQEKGLTEDANGVITSEHIKILRLVAAKQLNVLLQVGGMGEYLADCLYVARQHAALQQVLK